jgi:hypothetical protein
VCWSPCLQALGSFAVYVCCTTSSWCAGMSSFAARDVTAFVAARSHLVLDIVCRTRSPSVHHQQHPLMAGSVRYTQPPSSGALPRTSMCSRPSCSSRPWPSTWACSASRARTTAASPRGSRARHRRSHSKTITLMLISLGQRYSLMIYA